jgi:hypothetical protein
MNEPVIISDHLGELKTKQLHLAIKEFTQVLVSYKDTIEQHEGIVETTKLSENTIEIKVLYDYSAAASNQHCLLSAALGVYKIIEDTCIDMFDLSDDRVAGVSIPKFKYIVQFQFENGLNKQKLGIPPGNCTINLYKP